MDEETRQVFEDDMRAEGEIMDMEERIELDEFLQSCYN